MEKLEESKKVLALVRNNSEFQSVEFLVDHLEVEWLIEQVEKVGKLEKENQWLYGKLNIISDVIEQGRKELNANVPKGV